MKGAQGYRWTPLDESFGASFRKHTVVLYCTSQQQVTAALEKFTRAVVTQRGDRETEKDRMTDITDKVVS